MRRFLRSIRQFLSELRRRNVYRVALAYLAAGFVVVELANIAAGAFGLPRWFQPMVWTVCGLGFPIALVLAWALEMTPEGVRWVLEGGYNPHRLHSAIGYQSPISYEEKYHSREHREPEEPQSLLAS